MESDAKVKFLKGGQLMSGKLERNIEITSWMVTAILFILFIPRKKLREAFLAYKLKMAITWIFGLFVVEKGLIKYPKRLFFKKTTKSSFTFEFFVYPAICAIFNVNYPEKLTGFWKFLYYLFFAGTITAFEIFAVKYTKLIRYQNWKWYWSFITLWLTFYFSHIYYRWFFRKRKKVEEMPNKI
jgi:hypothetical protein